MKAVILSAGRGTRMGDLTNEICKPMLNIFDKPILYYKLKMLPLEVDEVIFVVGYLGYQIREYFGDSWNGLKISYVHQETLNGTGGAINLVKDMINDKFLVLMGDDLYYREDLNKMLDYELAILLQLEDDTSSFGAISFDDKDNMISIEEKDPTIKSAFVNTGAYLLNTSFFDMPLVKITEKEYSLPHTLEFMISFGHKIKCIKTNRWVPLGKPDDLKKGQEWVRKYFRE